MKKLEHCLLPLAICLFGACVSSLYPLSENEEEFIFKKEILGHWKADHDNEEYLIDTADKTTYRITVINKMNSIFYKPRYNDTSYYLAFLIKIQGPERLAFSEVGEEARNGFLLAVQMEK